MLKACWDCIAGNLNRQDDNVDAYGVRLNGDTQRAPPWPSAQHENEIMFVIPRQLNSGDRIEVSGQLRGDPRSVTVNLMTGYNSPDYQNIACQVETLFPASSQDKVTIKIVQNGYVEEVHGDYQDIPATDYFSGAEFNFGFSVLFNSYVNGHRLEVTLGQNPLETVILKHNLNDIRFLTLQGDIDKVTQLNFSFG